MTAEQAAKELQELIYDVKLEGIIIYIKDKIYVREH